MNLNQLRQLTRALVPGAKLQVIDNSTLDLILNEGVKDIAAYTVCLKANKTFNVKADVGEYNLSVEIADYLTVDKPGLWWYNGTIWRPVYSKTLKWLDENSPNWRSIGSRTPLYYSIDSDVLTVSPKPATAVSSGFWLYYGKRPTPMTKDDQYPFSGTTTELAHLSIFDMCIVKYGKWLIDPMLSKEGDANLSMREYLSEREVKKNQLYKRLDIAHSSDLGLRGPAIR